MITDEMVEKAAKAIDWISFEDADEFEERKAVARAALVAVLPDIVEQCAKAAENCESPGIGDNGAPERPDQYDVATAIRSLASLSFQDGKQ